MLSRAARIAYTVKHRLLSQQGYWNSTRVTEKAQTASSQLTQEHISKASNIKQLLGDKNLMRISEKPYFRLLIRRITQIMSGVKECDAEDMAHFERLMFELRKFSSSEVNSNTSDLINYNLMFKQLMTFFPKNYSMKGFEYRIGVLNESLPKIASFNGCEPVAMALLHYMGTISKVSTDNLKKNLLSYYVRYYTSRQMVAQTAELAPEPSFSNIDPNICAVMISVACNRFTKTVLESNLDQLALKNFFRIVEHSISYFGLSGFTKYFTDKQLSKKDASQLTQVERKQLRDYIKQNNQTLSLYSSQQEKGPEILLVNTLKHHLQVVDIFVNLLNFNYKNLTYTDTDYRSIEYFSQYVYLLFQVSHNMKAWVLDYETGTGYINPADVTTPEHRINERPVEISLWKVAALVLEGLAMDKVYCNNKGRIVKSIVSQINAYLGNLQTNRQDFKKNSTVILRTLVHLPVQQIKTQILSNKKSLDNLFQFFKVISESLPETKTEKSSYIKYLVAFARMKKSLLFNADQWFQIFSSLATKDESLQLWPLYFLLAQTKSQKLIDLIPFKRMIKRCSSEKAQIDKERIYLPPWQSDDSMNRIKQKQGSLERAKASSRNWQVFLLKIHALAISTNKQSQLPQLLKQNSVEFEITMDFLDKLFGIWLQPFSYHLLYHNNKTVDRQNKIQQEQHSIKFEFNRPIYQPIAFIQKYFHHIFTETECTYQTKLVHKILTNGNVEKGFLVWKVLPNFNFMISFNLVLLGLADPQHRQQYLEKYPFDQLTSEQFRNNSYYRFEEPKIVKMLYNKEQWEYYFKLVQKYRTQLFGREIITEIYNENCYYRECSVSRFKDGPEVSSPQLLQNLTLSEKDLSLKQGQIYAGFKYSEPEIIEWSKMFLGLYLNSLQNRHSDSVNIYCIFNVLVNSSFEIFSHINLTQNKSFAQIFGESLTKRFKLQVDNVKILTQKNYLNAFQKLQYMGFVDEALAENIIKNFKSQYSNSLLKIICYGIIGRQKSIEKNLITAEKWLKNEKLFNHLISVSGHLTKVIYFGFPYLDEVNLNRIEQYIGGIYHPFYRKMLLNKLKAFQKQKGLKIIDQSRDKHLRQNFEMIKYTDPVQEIKKSFENKTFESKPFHNKRDKATEEQEKPKRFSFKSIKKQKDQGSEKKQ